jgi:radical SAM protein with 4Fe4S-binding SPASM domain
MRQTIEFLDSIDVIKNKSTYNPTEHYQLNVGPTHEFGDAEECEPTLRNIGWTLGNDCPYRCTHCYSMSARQKGKDMSVAIVDRIVEQLAINNIETVNLGGNEPLFTNGPNPRNTMLPYIIKSLSDIGVEVGLTTSGITLLHLYRDHRDAFDLLNDVDVSFDSSDEDEHNKNRGANLYWQAIKSLKICQDENKPHSIIMAGMNWNFTLDRIERLVEIAAEYDANIRINPVKPVEPRHMNVALSPEQYYAGFARLLELCDPVDLGEPPIAAVTDYQHARRCPCGRTSFRIHSITPEGSIHVSPCVYLHDYKSALDLLKHDLVDIIHSPQFKVFRQRNKNPDMVRGCSGCHLLSQCGGGCSARSYLHHVHEEDEKSFLIKDPYCPVDIAPPHTYPQKPEPLRDQKLVHMDYLCTWIGRPK